METSVMMVMDAMDAAPVTEAETRPIKADDASTTKAFVDEVNRRMQEISKANPVVPPPRATHSQLLRFLARREGYLPIADRLEEIADLLDKRSPQ